jgi:hypothetical protein
MLATASPVTLGVRGELDRTLLVRRKKTQLLRPIHEA